MWWDIIKSNREEAYSHFVEQFGPESNPDDWEVFETLIIGDGWMIGLDSSRKVLLGSDEEYKPYRDFVLGMFKEEYPKRFIEILTMLNKLVEEEEVKVPTTRMSALDKKRFVAGHDLIRNGASLSNEDKVVLYKVIMILREDDEVYDFEIPRVDVSDFSFVTGNIQGLFAEFHRIATRENITELAYYLSDTSRMFGTLYKVKRYHELILRDSKAAKDIKKVLGERSIDDYKIVRV